MPDIPTLCHICGVTIIGDAAYIQHMETVHESSSPDQAMAKDKLKKANLPKGAIPLDPEALPSDEFMELAKMMDQPQSVPQPPRPPVDSFSHPNPQPQEVKKLELRYSWVGNCPVDINPVYTIELDVENKHFIIAICTKCHNKVASIEAENISKKWEQLNQDSLKKEEKSSLNQIREELAFPKKNIKKQSIRKKQERSLDGEKDSGGQKNTNEISQ